MLDGLIAKLYDTHEDLLQQVYEKSLTEPI